MTIDYRVGNTRDLTAALPDNGVHLVATSPPFLALRSYLPADHEHKHAEIGSEPDPATFLDTLLALTAEWGRVLAPWGSIAIELGDTYSGSGGAGGDYNAEGRLREGQNAFKGSASVGRTGRVGHDRDPQGFTGRSSHGVPRNPAWPRAKSLALIPQLYATSLAYGRNLLTGAPSPAGQWLVRNVVVWHRPNPAVGALGDKYRPSTSYIVVATRSPKRWFDLTAVRTPVSAAEWRKAGQSAGESFGGTLNEHGRVRQPDPAGAPPLDCWFDHDDHDTWTITTQPSRLAHYAMWPAKLAERLVLSMCPAEVCATCGEPRRRVSEHLGRDRFKSPMPPEDFGVEMCVAMERAHETVESVAAALGVTPWMVRHWRGETNTPQLPSIARWQQLDNMLPFDWGVRDALQVVGREYVTPDRGNRQVSARLSGGAAAGDLPKVVATGWTDCGHDDYAPGVVLDPFAGTGTTLAVADLHGRHGIGFDIDARNAQLMDARRAEVARNLFGTTPEIPGQLDIFDSTA